MVGKYRRPRVEYLVTVLLIPQITHAARLDTRFPTVKYAGAPLGPGCPLIMPHDQTHPRIRTETVTQVRPPDVFARRMKGMSWKMQLEGREQGISGKSNVQITQRLVLETLACLGGDIRFRGGAG